MKWEISDEGHPLGTATPYSTGSLVDQQWMDLEQQFQRFEQSLADGNFPLEIDISGRVTDPRGGEEDCNQFKYLDESLYDDVDIFPDLEILPPLPPLDVAEDDQYSCQPVEQIILAEDGVRIDIGKDLSEVSNGGSISQIRVQSSLVKNKAYGLQFGDLQKYFDRPILEAAKELKVGLTLLKKRCREVGIKRWPHRKLRSLKCLINNVKELGGLEKEVTMLEEQQKMLVKQPEMELNDQAKKIRQKSFKANHMRRRRKMACVVC